MASRGAANLAVRLTIHEVASLDTHRHTETRVDGAKNGEFKKKNNNNKVSFRIFQPTKKRQNEKIKKSKRKDQQSPRRDAAWQQNGAEMEEKKTTKKKRKDEGDVKKKLTDQSFCFRKRNPDESQTKTKGTTTKKNETRKKNIGLVKENSIKLGRFRFRLDCGH